MRIDPHLSIKVRVWSARRRNEPDTFADHHAERRM